MSEVEKVLMQLQISLVSLLDIFDRKRAQIMAQVPQIKPNELWEVEMTAAINEDKGEEAITDDPCTRLAWFHPHVQSSSSRRSMLRSNTAALASPTPALGGGF